MAAGHSDRTVNMAEVISIQDPDNPQTTILDRWYTEDEKKRMITEAEAKRIAEAEDLLL